MLHVMQRALTGGKDAKKSEKGVTLEWSRHASEHRAKMSKMCLKMLNYSISDLCVLLCFWRHLICNSFTSPFPQAEKRITPCISCPCEVGRINLSQAITGTKGTTISSRFPLRSVNANQCNHIQSLSIFHLNFAFGLNHSLASLKDLSLQTCETGIAGSMPLVQFSEIDDCIVCCTKGRPHRYLRQLGC